MAKKQKKKIVLHSNHCRVKTGFGKHMKHLLTYLHKNKNYEVIEFANGKQWNDPCLNNLPWRAYGSLPFESNLVQEIKADTNKQRSASYGHYKVDDLIKEQKPDIYLAIEDIWGVDKFWNKNWWNKINSIIWTPVDSLPLLDKHINAAQSTQNIVVQASFAKKAFEKQGFNNVHLLPVPIDTSNFHRLEDEARQNLRYKFKIEKEDFIIGFVFRNQLRKSVPNLLEGFKIFLDKNPDSNAKLLLHTHWKEGWDIMKLINEKSIDPKNILTTYYCDKCKQYEIKPFSGEGLDCRFCGAKKSQETSQIQRGVSEKQLNEIYNLMDVYCHPFTSGGQEIPIQEAKLTELVTLVTNYSCGEDYSSEESGGLPLDWNEYREPGTQFIKASTSSNDIFQKLNQVYSMSSKEKALMGKKARDFVIDFCSIESVCSKFLEILDGMDKSSWDFDFSYINKDTNYPMQQIASDRDWLIDLYKNMLKVEDPEVQEKNGILHWEKRLNSDLNRNQVYDYFVKIARDSNSKNNQIPFSELLSNDDEGKRILFVLPGNDIDVIDSTSLLPFIKESNPDHNIYYATQKENFELVSSNPNVYKVVPYDKVMENFSWGEGQGKHDGFFNFVLIPHSNTHITKNYIHGNKYKLNYDINHA